MNPATVSINGNSELPLKYYFYGWGRFRCGGILSKPLFAYIILCTCVFVQNFSVNGANNAVVSTIERVFYLNSVQSGLFLSLYDLATVFSSPVIGYLNNLYSSPIFFSLNMLIISIGNILIASSNFIDLNNRFHFSSNSIQSSLTSDNVLFQCNNNPLFASNNTTDSICLKEDYLSSSAKNAKFLLYAGNFINGIGSVALFTIGIPYIERIFPPEKAAYCQGIYFAVGTVGGALGIVATGRFLLLYTKLTPRRYLPSWLTTTHPLWIGCWWLPYFLYASLCFLISIFVSGLPNFGIPGKKHPIRNNITVIITTSAEQQQQPNNTAIITRYLQIPVPDNKSSRSDLNVENGNRPDLTSSPVTENNIKNGFINHAFSTENLNNQPININSVTLTENILENTTAHRESNDNGLKNMFSVIWELLKNIRCVFIIVTYLFEGILLKGFVPFITKYFEYQHQLDTSTATLIAGAIALFSVVIGSPAGAYFINKYSWTPMQCARICSIILITSSFLFLFLIFSCPELKFQYSSCFSMNTPCCQQVYHPVCDIRDPHKMFLSPCHFGCINQTTITSNNTILYSSCNCAAGTIVSETVCRFRRIPCTVIFVLTLFGATFLVFFTAFIQVPMLQVLLHSVPLVHQSMALALRQTIVRVLGQTTGPLLFGYIFDRACLIWLTDCYGRKTCKLYDNRRMSLSMALLGFSVRLMSGLTCSIVYIKWRLIQSSEVESISNTRHISNDVSTDPSEPHEITRL